MLNKGLLAIIAVLVIFILMGTFTPLFSEINFLITGQFIANTPPKVILVNPQDGEVILEKNPIISWNYLDNNNDPQTLVIIQISEDNLFNDPITVYFAGTSTSTKLGRTLDSGTYYWRMKAKDTEWGAWSETQSFSIGSSLNRCEGGTYVNTCSTKKPLFCNPSTILVNNCANCGCPEGLECNEDGTCSKKEEKKCLDNTLYSQCSTVKPNYCLTGLIVERCDLCGCPENFICEADGSCVEKKIELITEPRPTVNIINRIISFLKILF